MATGVHHFATWQMADVPRWDGSMSLIGADTPVIHIDPKLIPCPSCNSQNVDMAFAWNADGTDIVPVSLVCRACHETLYLPD